MVLSPLLPSTCSWSWEKAGGRGRFAQVYAAITIAVILRAPCGCSGQSRLVCSGRGGANEAGIPTQVVPHSPKLIAPASATPHSQPSRLLGFPSAGFSPNQCVLWAFLIPCVLTGLCASSLRPAILPLSASVSCALSGLWLLPPHSHHLLDQMPSSDSLGFLPGVGLGLLVMGTWQQSSARQCSLHFESPQ